MSNKNNDSTVKLNSEDIKKIENASKDETIDLNSPVRQSNSKTSNKKGNDNKNNNNDEKDKTRITPSPKKYIKRMSKLVGVLIVLMAIIGGLIGLGYLFIQYNNAVVNDATFYKGKHANSIYDSEGNFITSFTSNYIDWTEFKKEDGTYNIPEQYYHAVIATEDRNFETHNGVDLPALVKGVAYNVRGDDRGGSTLTMQLGKILYLEDYYLPDENGYIKSSDHVIEYKVKQMAYAYKIEQIYSKDQIFENYINSVNYGGAFGIQNASKFYFGHDAKDLTLSESVLLAGIPQKPTEFNPFLNPEAATKRRDAVLAAMLDAGYIDKETYDKEIKVNIKDLLKGDGTAVGTASEEYIPYIDKVQKELTTLMEEKTKDMDKNTTTEINGLKIYTNMDSQLQKNNYNKLSKKSNFVWQNSSIQVGTAQIDTQNGAIYSLINGRGNRGTNGTNFAFNYYVQPGSTAKPLVDYGPAYEYLKWSTYHPVSDAKLTYRNGPEINNAGGTSDGMVTAQYALGHSLNRPAVRTFYDVIDEIGRDKLGKWLENLGITDLPKTQDGKEYYVRDAYAIGGWDNGTTPLEMAGAYAAFGNGGTYNEPHAINYIETVENSKAREIFGEKYEMEYESRKVMEPSTAYLMTQSLDVTRSESIYSSAAARGGYSGVNLVGHQGQAAPGLSAKTGTSDWGDSGLKYGIAETSNRYRWLAGYTENVTSVAWVGFLAEDEAKGMTPFGNDVYEVFHVITWYANDSTNKLLHDGKKLSKPSNVTQKSMRPIPSGDTDFYFINGSNEEINATPDAPTIKDSKIDGNIATVNWDDGATAGSSYAIYVDGKKYKTSQTNSTTLTAADLANFTKTCKTSYSVTVTSVTGEEESPQSSPLVVDYGNKDFCGQ